MAGPKKFSTLRAFVMRPRVLIVSLANGLPAAPSGYVVMQLTRVPPPLTAVGPGYRALELAALRAYAARGEQGSLLPQSDAVIAIREQFLQRVIDRSLPFRQYFDDGRYVARLDSADVRLESGVAMVTLLGRGMQSGLEDSPIFADLAVGGLINVTGIDRKSGTLQATLVFTDVRARRAGSQGLQALLNPVARYFGRLKADDWNRNRQRIHLPVQIDREIILPALDGDVALAESRVPLSAWVSAVTTLQDHMAISLALLSDSAGSDTTFDGKEATGIATGSRPKRRPWLSWLRGVDQPETEEASLRVEVARLAREDALWRGVVASDHDVVALVPARVMSAVVARASQRYVGGADVDIHPTKVSHLDQVVRARVLGNKTGVGRIKGTVLVSHLKGRLTVAGDPRVTFEPPGDLVVTAPIQILGGRGAVTVDMDWDPAFLVSMVCRGFRFQETLVGEIQPFRDDVTMRIRCAVRDSSIVGRMRLQRDVIRFSPDLTDSSWSRVLAILVSQDRFTRCGMAMNPDSLLMTLKRLARRGVNVRLPERLFKPFRLPVMLESQYSAGDYRIEARAFDPAIAVTPEYLRLAFRADLRVSSVARDAGRDSAVIARVATPERMPLR